MSVIDASLTLISSIIGAGIVSVPYALSTTGFMNGIYINVGLVMALMFSCHLYIKAMQYFKLNSISELIFMSLGRSSIFLVNGFYTFIFF